MKIDPRRIIFVLCAVGAVFSAPVLAGAQSKKLEAAVIAKAKNTPVSQIERNLSKEKFVVWLQKQVGPKNPIAWEVNDCGEQSGTSEDRGRDFPMCVESSARITDAIFLRVSIQYGTFKRGILGGRPVVRSIFYGDESGAGGVDVKDLRELRRDLSSIKKSLEFFDPDNGVFYISGNKPAGFEDVSEMWLETMDDDLRGKKTPVKKNGGIEFGQKDYAMRKIFFDGKSWSFETVVVDGVSFSFNGRFAKPRLDSHGAALGDNVLQGRLIKFVNGKKTAEADLIFSFVIQGE